MVDRRVVKHVDDAPIEEQNARRALELGSKVEQLRFITVELREELKRQNDDLKVCDHEDVNRILLHPLEVTRLNGFDQESARPDTSSGDISHGIR